MSNVSGNTGGLKTAQLRALDRLAGRRVSPDRIVSPELAREIAGMSFVLGRQIGVLIDRAGRVFEVVVGDHRGIMLPVLPQIRGTGGRLKGLRCVHTHLAGEDLNDDDLMDLLFLRFDLMAMIKVDENGYPERLYAAHLLPTPLAGRNWVFLDPVVPSQQTDNFLELINSLEQEFARVSPRLEVDGQQDRAILISVTTLPREVAEDSMAELVELAGTAEVHVAETVIQRPRKINPRIIMGRGKLGEIMLKALVNNANLLIFDQELSPSQIRSITDHTEMRVIDRTQLILDIFARRALSREGKLQIEMAQLKYLLPRLGTRDDALSRLTGGIGARGPGETKLEIDRRRIQERLAILARKLEQVGRERHHRRSRRRKKDLPVISLVGYTNAGKSTLLNTLTHSQILAEDKLFATLDPTSRRLRFPRDLEVVITDTVGFIRDLPDELLLSFKSTLEELHEADLLVHVIDLGNPAHSDQIRVVDDLLRELKLDTIPCLRVLNKIDLVDPAFLDNLARQLNGFPLSAMDSKTFGPFLDRAQDLIMKKIV
ncbi:MAG: GTPase HflX [Proteobacteria bacterium]|nr:GTPase HflX [Pseudomonadota bacterium]MBU1688950.1 GTPase HflX [Pseudomonadota bacterium]